MDEYKIGYLTQKDTFLATLYAIPADRGIAEELRFIFDDLHPPVWQVRDTGKELHIYYEAEADICKFPVYKKAEGEIYEAALRDIERAVKRVAA